MSAATYSGNSHYYLLDRLSKTHPELVKRVEAGELTAHAAAVAAGLRPKAVTMRTDDPHKLAKAIFRHVKPEHIDELVAILAAGAA